MAHQRVMLVEGKEDLHVLASLFRFFGRERYFHVEEQGGIDELKNNLPAYLKASDLKCLAVVVDADFDVAARWQSIRSILLSSGYASIASEPVAEGTVVQQEGKPAVGIWLMPDNSTEGMLERFASLLIPEGDSLWSRAQTTIGSIPPEERKFGPTAASKAEIHTWLAWQEEPGRSIGTAITLRYLDANRKHGRDLWRWLQSLAAAGDVL